MSSTSDAAAAALIEVEVWGVTLTRYLSVMGMVLVQYDLLLTLDDEVRLVWPGTLSWPKALYYINRYVSVVFLIYGNYQIANFRPALSVHLSVCHTGVLVMTAADIIRYLAATALLCLRVVVLYHGVRWMKWLLWICFVLCYGIRSVIIAGGGYYYAESIIYSPRSDQCLPGAMKRFNTPLYGITSVVSPMPFDILLLTLTIIKAFKSTTLLDSRPISPMMRALMRDEILWFLVIIITRLSMVVSWFVLPPFLMTVASNAGWGLESALISRFFLNLRSIHHHGQCTVGNRPVLSMLSAVHTHPNWRRATGVTPSFSDGFEAGTGVSGGLSHRHEGNAPEAATDDLELAIVTRTRHVGDGQYTKPIADLVPPDSKLPQDSEP